MAVWAIDGVLVSGGGLAGGCVLAIDDVVVVDSVLAIDGVLAADGVWATGGVLTLSLWVSPLFVLWPVMVFRDRCCFDSWLCLGNR